MSRNGLTDASCHVMRNWKPSVTPFGSASVLKYVWIFYGLSWKYINNYAQEMLLEICSIGWYWLCCSASLQRSMAWHRSHFFFMYLKVRCEVVFSGSQFSISAFRDAFLRSWLHSSEIKSLLLGERCIVVIPRFNLILKDFTLIL